MYQFGNQKNNRKVTAAIAIVLAVLMVLSILAYM